MKKWYGYEIHPSHERVVDVSDVSLTVDLVCDKCRKKDNNLEEPCIQDFQI